ncbi:MAG: ComF family protein [Ruminiclostridium sp.]|nr:ComF family protein [Ruminiclostridium sp.]
MDRAKLHRIYRYWIDWLYPNICPCCGGYIDYDADFCVDCKSRLNVCKDTLAVAHTDGAAAYCIYDDNIKGAVLAFKKNRNGNSYYAFACGIAEAVRKSSFAGDIDMIVPIPASKKNMKERGYNQSELIAQELRFLLGVPYGNVLVKAKETKVQKRLGMNERAENVIGAFAVNEKNCDIAGKRLLVIDDVCTTGSTLAEAAKVLKENGAAKVYAAAFAKTPFKS